MSINNELDHHDGVTFLPAATTQAPEQSEKKDAIQIELSRLNEMLSDKCEFRQVLTQLYKIMSVLHRLGSRQDKIYSLDKELEMQVEIKKVKKTYNNWGVLTISILSGGLTIIGGAAGIFGALPGTSAGAALGKIMPFFNGADAAKKISSVSSGISGIGQGAGAFGKIFENKDEAQRAVLNFGLQQMQRKHEDRSRSSNEEGQGGKEALRNLSQSESEAHNIATLLLKEKS